MPKTKICGLRSTQDAQHVNAAMPAYAGFVFAPGKRQVSAAQAAEIRAALHPAIQAVGVFVNHPIEEITALCRAGTIQLAQLHGDEDEAYIARLKQQTGAPVIRMVPVGESLPPLPQNAEYILFDTLSPARGGTGKAFNWELLHGYEGPPFFLAGGLTPENVTTALQTVQSPLLHCVDVSSGVETAGTKDSEKIHTFVKAVKERTT